jgi:hypothetical protein
MRVRLVKKFADKIDGVDLSEHSVGARLQMKDRDAQLLIAEGWAVPEVGKKNHITGRSEVPEQGVGRPKRSRDR